MIPETLNVPHWGLYRDGVFTPMSVYELARLIESGIGEVQWNGGTARPEVVYVTRPDATRPVAAVECPELHAAILKRDEAALEKTRFRNGLLFYPLFAIAFLLAMAESVAALLPAVYAVITGAAHLESWLALHRLVADPRQYLRDCAARLRYASWLSLANKHWSRTSVLVGLWAVIYGIQLFVPGAQGAEPGYVEAAALVKNRVADEAWRLLTAAMLHGSVLHALMNAMTMLSLGAVLERGVHRHLMLPVWLVGAVAGSLLSWAASAQTSVGASGGILAVLSFLLVMGWRCRDQLPPDFGGALARSVGMIVLLGLLAWDAIDNAAHLGGAIASATVAFGVLRPQTALPLADSLPLAIVGRLAEVIVVCAALFTIAKLLMLFR